MREWYNMTELAEKTNIPDTTCRRYIAKFPDFFMSKGGTRSKRYEDSSVKILIRIKNLFDSGFETEEVDLTLRKEFPTVVDGDKVEGTKETLVMPTVEDMAEIKQALKEQAEFNKQLLERLDQQQQYIKTSLEQRDKALMASLKESMESQKLIAASVQEEEEKRSGGSFGNKIGI